jgi:hypothetical protein
MKVLVTGGTHGMGKGVAQILAGRDGLRHEVIILGRSARLGEATVEELQGLTGNQKISSVTGDLSRLSEVRAVIQELGEKHESLDAIFVNAGLGYAPRREETEDGMDPHFQVNYLSHFMLTLNLLPLLQRSREGGRVIFNVAHASEVFWDDLQLKEKWSYEAAIFQAMVLKRMFYTRLHHLLREAGDTRLSFYGYLIAKTVWSNQLNIIPFHLKAMATLAKLFGTFISIEACGEIMAPLFTEDQEESLKRSGKYFTSKKGAFVEKVEDAAAVLDREQQERLWKISLELCRDEQTTRIAAGLTA